MEVADEIVVINEGRVEQVGAPDDLYERPANEFVMGFLGPVTRLDGRLVRPHDVEVLEAPAAGAVGARVARVVRLGFEVRLDAVVGGEEVWVQLTRGQARSLDLSPGAPVWLHVAERTEALVGA
ncbi:MAG: TOBE-like domain-containing protein [Actinobacteria bacterium]|nr:TOBE-like domain-containing protein [Actinomycetota bacterium]